MLKCRTILAAALAAVPLFAGGLFVTLGNPEANPQARAMGAVLTLKLAGCHEPEKAEVTATAVDGARSIPLKLAKLDEPGSYAVTQQWPKEGRWVLQFIARDGERITSTLVAAGPNGSIERDSAKYAMKLPDPKELTALLARR